MRISNNPKLNNTILAIAIILLITLLPTLPTNITSNLNPNVTQAKALATQSTQQPVPAAPFPNATINALRSAGYSPQQEQAWQLGMLDKLSFSGAYGLANQLHVTKIAGKDTNVQQVTSAKPRPKTVSTLNIPIDTTDSSGNTWRGQPSIAMNPTNDQIGYAVDQNKNNGMCIVFETSDGGQNWYPDFSLATTGTFHCLDPVVRWSPDGHIAYFVYIDESTNNVNLVRDTCYGYGCIDSQVVLVGNSGINYIYDEPWVDVHEVDYAIQNFQHEPSQAKWVYLTATYFDIAGNNEIIFLANNNYGSSASWVYSYYLWNCHGAAYLCQFARPIGGMYNTLYSHGDVLVCWYNSLADGSASLRGKFAIQCRHSPSNGFSWYDPTFATPTPSYAGYELPYYLCPDELWEYWWSGMGPSIAISPDGKAHITYTASTYDQTTGNHLKTNCGDVKYVSSKPFDYDNIPVPPATTHQSWLAARTVASGALAQGFSTITVQIRPPLPPTTLGYRLYLFWYDAKNSPTTCTVASCNANMLYDVYMASSNNGGTSFLTATRITQQSSLVNFIWIGEHFDSSATSRIAWVIWTDRADKLNTNDLDNDIYGEGISAL